MPKKKAKKKAAKKKAKKSAKPVRKKEPPKPSDVFNKYELTKTEQYVLHLKIKFPEMDSKQVGEVMGIHAATVRTTWARPIFKKALQNYHVLAIDRVDYLREHAARVYEDLLHNGSETVRERAARYILQGPGGVLHQKVTDDGDNSGFIVVSFPDGDKIAMGSQKKIKELNPGEDGSSN